MNVHVCANLAFVALLLAPTRLRLLGAGAVGGLSLSLNNPLPHLLFAWPWWLLVARGAGGLRRASALLAGYLPVALVLVIGWFAFSESLREVSAPLVGKSAFSRPSLELLRTRAEGLSKLVLWAPFGLLPFAVLGAVRRAREPAVLALALSALSLLLAYFLVKFDQGYGWGYRYFHPAFGCLPLLAALALAPTAADARPTRGLLLRACLGWCLGAALLSLPGRIAEVGRVVAAHRAQLAAAPAGQDCVHFVGRHGVSSTDLIANDPLLRGNLFLFAPNQAELESIRASHFGSTKLVATTRVDRVYCGMLADYKAKALGHAGEGAAR